MISEILGLSKILNLESIFLDTNFNISKYFRCVLPRDDPFAACFGCGVEIRKKRYIDRQTNEMFFATAQSQRVVCRSGMLGRRACSIRVDRAMELRSVTYGRSLQFIQSEQYLSDEDISIIRRLKRI